MNINFKSANNDRFVFKVSENQVNSVLNNRPWHLLEWSVCRGWSKRRRLTHISAHTKRALWKGGDGGAQGAAPAQGMLRVVQSSRSTSHHGAPIRRRPSTEGLRILKAAVGCLSRGRRPQRPRLCTVGAPRGGCFAPSQVFALFHCSWCEENGASFFTFVVLGN
jgi:hypothetical protein